MKIIYGLLLFLLVLIISGCVSNEVGDEVEKSEGIQDVKKDETSIKYTTIEVHESERRQVIDGFGASGAWWAEAVGGWSDANLTEVMDLLFDKEKGIGLSMYRYNVGAGETDAIEDPWRSSATLESSPGVFDVDNDAYAVRVLIEAKERGVEQFIAFANSPPARLTISGKVTGGEKGGSNLAPENYEAFAEYMIGVGDALRQEGIPINYLSPVNEPQWDWQESKGQEGCHYEPEEAAAMVGALIKKVEEQDLDYIVSGVEAGEWKDAMDYYDLMAASPYGDSLDHFAGHSYWSGSMSKKMFARNYWSKEQAPKLWMSEWTEMESGRDYGMTSAMLMANTIFEDLTILNASSWQYWIAVSKYDWKDGLIYTSGTDEVIETTKRLYTMGQFSRFVRPDFYRNEVEGKVKLVDMVAFCHPDLSQSVVVFINRDDDEKHIKIQTEETYESTTIYATDEKMDMTVVHEGAFSDVVHLTPRSVTTVVFDQ